MTLKVDEYKNNLEIVHKLIHEGKVISASSIKFGGLSEAITKMTLGNKIGANIKNVTKEELFGLNYGSLVLEVKSDVEVDKELAGCAYKAIGKTIKNGAIILEDYDINFEIESLEKTLEEKLTKVFKIKTVDKNEKVNTQLYKVTEAKTPTIKVAKPRVFIPVATY